MNLIEATNYYLGENILTEEVYGKIATFYHRTKSEEISKTIGKDGFTIGLGDYYGPAIYGCFDIKDQFQPSMFDYGDYIVKSKTNIFGFIILDETIAKKVYGGNYLPKDQFKSFCNPSIYANKKTEALKKYLNSIAFSGRTAEIAHNIWGIIKNDRGLHAQIKGLLYIGGYNDGDVIVIYDVNNIIPMGYAIATKDTKMSNLKWEKTFDKAVVQSVSKKSLRPLNKLPSAFDDGDPDERYTEDQRKAYLIKAMREGYDVIKFIVEYGYADVLSKAIREFKQPVNSEVLDSAITVGDYDVIEVILDAGVKPSDAALTNSVSNNDVFDLLVNAGAKCNKHTLEKAMLSYSPPMLKKVIDLMKSQGVVYDKINTSTDLDYVISYYTEHKTNKKLMNTMVDILVDADIVKCDGTTLDFAIRSGSIELVNTILDFGKRKGIDFDMSRSLGYALDAITNQGAFNKASENIQLINKVIDLGAEPRSGELLKAVQTRDPDVVEIILDLYDRLGLRVKNGGGILDDALFNTDIQISKLLINAGVNPTDSSLKYAVRTGVSGLVFVVMNAYDHQITPSMFDAAMTQAKSNDELIELLNSFKKKWKM